MIVILALVVIAAGALGIVGFYAYKNKYYVSTDDARVTAELVTISPQLAGSIQSWQVKEGDTVRMGDVLGRQDLGTALTSGALSPQTLGTVGGVIAEKALLRAPINGEVIKSNALVGEMAAPGMVLAIIADTDHIYISANIKEGSIMRIKTGTGRGRIRRCVSRTRVSRPDREHRSGYRIDIFSAADSEQLGKLYQSSAGDTGQNPFAGDRRIETDDRNECGCARSCRVGKYRKVTNK